MPAVRNEDGGFTDESTPCSANPLARSLLAVRTVGLGSHLNIVLLDFNPEAMFAGVKTALETATLFASLTGRPIRLLLLRPSGLHGADRARFLDERRTALRTVFSGSNWSILCDDDLSKTSFGCDDIWLATHWMTAHAMDLASRSNAIDKRLIVYLVQDYEPDYFAGELDRPAAESTYRAGFTLLVNSRQVAQFLRTQGVEVDDRHVFAPKFDLRELRTVASHRMTEPTPQIFFYGRPSTPRNMFSLGLAVARRTAEELASRGLDATFVMAGEDGPSIDLGCGFVMRNLGVLDRKSYFDEISHIDVGLALQATPHPSHLPFDLAISGAFAVTNEVDGSRNEMHPRIVAARAAPEELSALLVAMLDRARSTERVRVGYLPVKDGQLGSTLRSAVKATIEDIARARP